jgi:MoaA/NifB/PqqE/SkfB family radical SAM enzyme
MRSHYLEFLKRKAEYHLLGKKRPLLAGLKITHKCNLRCKACPFWRKNQAQMSYGLALETINRLYAEGVRLLIIEGGEPFLWRDNGHGLEDIIREAKKLFFCTAIVTNGTLPIETEADVVWVSIDGLRDSHNQNRGNSFDRIIANIKASSHPKILANVTFNRLNWREVDELVEFLGGLVKGITFQFYYPYTGTEDLSLTLEQRKWVLERLLALKKRGYPILASRGTIEALKNNSWRCHDWLIASADPDGTIHIGCYLKGRDKIMCDKCGFAAHVEMSLAFDLTPEAIWVGRKVFGFKLLEM